MTPMEIKTALSQMAREIGPRADVTVMITSSNRDKPLYAVVYPDSVERDSALSVRAHDWPALLAELRSKWDERSAEYSRKTIRKMALEIIRITAELGECTDAALRAGEFGPGEVAQFGEEAIADANTIASNGPFAIVSVANANAA